MEKINDGNVEEHNILELTLSNYIYTKEGKEQIRSIEKVDGVYFINRLILDNILMFDISWIGEKEFLLYGFKKVGNSTYEKGTIKIGYNTFDHWHVYKGKEDLGRFYTAQALENRVKEHFDIDLTLKIK